MWEIPDGMDKYLSPTGLCDSDSQKIRKKARKIIKDAKTPKEAAIKIFYFVRDHILFAMDNFDVKASETLERGVGQYVTKTNLQVALLRAMGIPARYHLAVLSKDCLKGLIPEFAYRNAPEKLWWHPWCECFLSGRWVSCDSLLDKKLYDDACKKGIISKEQIPTIDWDGENDLNMTSAWILEDKGAFHSLDDVFKKAQKEVLPPKIVTRILFYFSNRYTDKLRKQ